MNTFIIPPSEHISLLSSPSPPSPSAIITISPFEFEDHATEGDDRTLQEVGPKPWPLWAKRGSRRRGVADSCCPGVQGQGIGPSNCFSTSQFQSQGPPLHLMLELASVMEAHLMDSSVYEIYLWRHPPFEGRKWGLHEEDSWSKGIGVSWMD